METNLYHAVLVNTLNGQETIVNFVASVEDDLVKRAWDSYKVIDGRSASLKSLGRGEYKPPLNLDLLKKTLREDATYRDLWKANIAMACLEDLRKSGLIERGHTSLYVESFGRGAERFIAWLCE